MKIEFVREIGKTRVIIDDKHECTSWNAVFINTFVETDKDILNYLKEQYGSDFIESSPYIKDLIPNIKFDQVKSPELFWEMMIESRYILKCIDDDYKKLTRNDSSKVFYVNDQDIRITLSSNTNILKNKLNDKDYFIEILKTKNYNYYINDQNIIINHNGDVNLESLESIPENVHFKNNGYVDLKLLETIPPNTRFYIKERLDISSVKHVGANVFFNINKGDVIHTTKPTLAENIEFNSNSIIINKTIL